MTETYENLMQLLSAALFNAPCNTKLTEEIRTEAKKQAVLSLVDTQASATLAQNIRVIHEHLQLHELLTANGIPYVILKGCASASYYPVPERRTLGDVDFLVYEKDLNRVDALLRDNGYTLESKLCDHHWGYDHDGRTLEMHWRINGIPEGESGRLTEKYMSDVIEQAGLKKCGSGVCVMPSDFHHGIICILHIARHMTSSGMGLRHLCDWAVFVNSINDFPGLLQACFESIGVMEFARQLTALCTRYLGLPKQPWAGEYSEAFLSDLIEDILSGGNFGRKKSTVYEGVFTNSEGKGRLLTGIRSMNKIVCNYWPILSKVPVLLPLGWLWFCGRYLIRVITGKRKMLSAKTFREADRRSELYEKFRLFETQ